MGRGADHRRTNRFDHLALSRYRTSMHVCARGLFTYNGVDLGTFETTLNTAMVIGGDPVRLATRIFGQGDIHAWIDGPNRTWIADIIDEGLDTGVYRKGIDGRSSKWEEVQALLRSSSNAPVVMSYSVESRFPDRKLTDYELDENDESPFGLLPDDKQWDLCMQALRSNTWPGHTGLELRPGDWKGVRFGYGLSLCDLLADDYRQRIETALTSTRSTSQRDPPSWRRGLSARRVEGRRYQTPLTPPGVARSGPIHEIPPEGEEMTYVRVGNVISRKDAIHAHPPAQGIIDDATHADTAEKLDWLASTGERLGLENAGIIAPDTGEMDILSDALRRIRRHLVETGAPLHGVEPESVTVNLDLHTRLRELAHELAALADKDPDAADGFAAKACRALDESGDTYTGYYERYVNRAREIAEDEGGIAFLHRQAREEGAPAHILEQIKEQALAQARWAAGEDDLPSPF